MANVHLTFGYAGGLPGGPARTKSALQIFSFATASQTLTGTSGTSSAVASGRGTNGDPIARVYSDAAVKIAFGPTPTAATPWHFQPASETRDYGVTPGDKLYFATV